MLPRRLKSYHHTLKNIIKRLKEQICCVSPSKQTLLYFWGWCKTSAAVQNNKQYIFYNGSTKIAFNISFLALLVLLFCFKITREEKAWLILNAFLQWSLFIYLSNLFFFFVLCSPASALRALARLLFTVASLGYFTYFNCSNVYLHQQ